MDVTLAYVQQLAANKAWHTIIQLAESRDWPEEPGSLPVFIGMMWAIQVTSPQGLGFQRAMAFVKRAYRSHPDLATLAIIQLNEVSLCAEAGDIYRAIEVLESDPLSQSSLYRWHVLQNLAMCHRRLGDWDKALASFDAAILESSQVERRRWQSEMDRSLTLVEAGRIRDAMDFWEGVKPPTLFLGMHHLLGAEVFSDVRPAEALCQGVLALHQLRLEDREATGMPISEYRARTHLAMAKAHLALGERSKALCHCHHIAELGNLGCPPEYVRQADILGNSVLEERRLSFSGEAHRYDALALVH